jgi:ketosteroid isomerase-like protein
MARKLEAGPERKLSKSAAKTAPAPASRRSPPARARARKPRLPVPAEPPPPPPADVVQVIEQLNRRYYDAFQTLNIEEMSRIWWHDDAAACIHPGWDVRHGWAAVRDSFGDIFSNTRSIRFALGDVRVRIIGAVAYVGCIENLVSEESDTGDYLGAVLATNIFERRGAEWRLIHHHASPFASDEADLPEGPLH